MATILKLLPTQEKKKSPKVSLKIDEKIYGDFIVAQQSLPTKINEKYIPIVDVNQRFEETIQNCRKKPRKQKKIPELFVDEKVTRENTRFNREIVENLINNEHILILNGKSYKRINRERYKSECEVKKEENPQRRASVLVDQLLLEIYGRNCEGRRRLTETDCSSMTSFIYDDKKNENLHLNRLVTKGIKCCSV